METLSVTKDNNIQIESFVQIAQTGLLYQIKQNEQTLSKIKESIELNKLEVAQMTEHFISELNKTKDISEESLSHCKSIADKMGLLESQLKKNVVDFSKNQESLRARLDIFLQLENMQKSETTQVLFPEWRKNYTTYIVLEYLIIKNIIKPNDSLLKELTQKGTFDYVQIFQKGMFFDYNEILNNVLESHNLDPVFEFISYVKENHNDDKSKAVKQLEIAAHWAKFVLIHNTHGEEQGVRYIRENMPHLLDELVSLNLVDNIASFFLSDSNKAMQFPLNDQKVFETNENVFGIPSLNQRSKGLTLEFPYLVQPENHKVSYDNQTSQEKLKLALEGVIKKFKTAFFEFHHLPQVPMLVLHLLLGAAALHSKECHQHSNVIMKTLSKPSSIDLTSNQIIRKFIESNYLGTDCPLCDSTLDWIKSRLPYSGKPGSNQTFDHDAVKSPSGYVYDKAHLLNFFDELTKFVQEKHLLKNSQGEEHNFFCIDPMSREPFDLAKLEKVYPL
ncbi:Protein FYV10 [Hanseniaspora osmophila]|uniref:Protein FYV10 n=1 Tax=Hanseniaspora osmophila TaxID=56408 RepID=A0A1E5RNA6_9ASCO|nr:Protein FYV10 [Hanseniaspora osmophila]